MITFANACPVGPGERHLLDSDGICQYCGSEPKLDMENIGKGAIADALELLEAYAKDVLPNQRRGQLADIDRRLPEALNMLLEDHSSMRSTVIALKAREIVLESLLERVERATRIDGGSDALLMTPADPSTVDAAMKRIRDGQNSGAGATLELLAEIRRALGI